MGLSYSEDPMIVA